MTEYDVLLSFAEYLGLSVGDVPFQYVKGLIINQDIGIREDLPEEQKTATLSHELGQWRL